jgi:AraC-like DNA-binding protein
MKDPITSAKGEEEMRSTGTPVGYHMVYQLFDGGTVLEEPALFSQSLNAVLDGFVPIEDLAHQSMPHFAPYAEDTMESRARLLIRLSLNPMSLIFRAMPNLQVLPQVFNMFGANPALGIRNQVEMVGSDDIAISYDVKVPLTPQVSSLCREAVSCLFDVTRRYIQGDLPLPPQEPMAPLGFDTLLSLGRTLNQQNAPAFELIEVLKERPDVHADAAAAALGCSGRTLQRQLQARSLSLPRLRLAGNLLRGVGLLCRGGSLSHVAADAGFSDYSHFARTLGRSCGIRPTSFQSALALLDTSRLQTMA